MNCTSIIWLIIALLFSLYFGIRMFYHEMHFNQKESTEKNFIKIFIFAVHALIMNFFGSLFGWICLYILFLKHSNNYSIYLNFDLNFHWNFDWSDLFLFIFAFTGIIGFLTQIIISTATSLSGLLQILVNKLTNAIK